ncbi:MAG: endonuclease/exonuclease/phosphatase family protein [Brevibacillus sp.]|nr:endonuclease/exonuclease/phosphatase family protein [Brevibacillus sp.]
MRVVSYNIHSGKDVWGRKRFDQMAEMLEHLQADVIALQEVHQNNRYGYQAEQLAHHLNLCLVYGPAIQTRDGSYGNALLSRLPVISGSTLPLKAKREPRSLLKSTLLFGGQPIDVWVTHCSLDRHSRTKQLQIIRREIGMQSARPLLIAGDFNTGTPPLSPPLQDCGAEAGGASIPTMLTMSRRIDYIFASSEWCVQSYQVLPEKWSDHYPLVVTLTLSGRPVPPSRTT